MKPQGDRSPKKKGRQRDSGGKKDKAAAARTSNRKAEGAADNCKIGDDFHYTHNAVLLVVTCVPLFVTCHLASIGSRALAGWIVVTGE